MKQNKQIIIFCHFCIPCYLPNYLDCNGVRAFLLKKETCPWWLCLGTWNWSPWLGSDLRLMCMISFFPLTVSVRSVSSVELLISKFASYKRSHNPPLFPSSYSYSPPQYSNMSLVRSVWLITYKYISHQTLHFQCQACEDGTVGKEFAIQALGMESAFLPPMWMLYRWKGQTVIAAFGRQRPGMSSSS